MANQAILHMHLCLKKYEVRYPSQVNNFIITHYEMKFRKENNKIIFKPRDACIPNI